MTPDKKRKLRNIAILSLLGLIGGTFAFTAFNQQAINDRENDVQVNVGGRVHDYYNAETENKDVFVENYGERPIMARIRLSEFLEYQRGEGEFTQLIGGSERDNVDSWTTWIPSETNVNVRANIGNSNEFNRYSNLRFGRAGESPWYLPTFNHNNLDLSTAAAGDARDLADGSDDVTHPGEGTDGYWGEGETYTNGENGTTWHGAADGTERTTRRNLPQERMPMTIQEWMSVPNDEKIGDFWVVDHTTGWAYWASLLEPEEATSYLLDAAEMTDAIEDTVFNGSYYYGIHVDSQLISPDNSGEFLNDGDTHNENLNYFLEGIKNNAIDDDFGNPAYNIDSAPSDFRFHLMNPGRIFTMEGEQYRYLEEMDNGNHMIIRNEAISPIAWNDQEQELMNWYGDLHPEVQNIVQPVAEDFDTGIVGDISSEEGEQIDFGGPGNRWVINNITAFPEVATDITKVQANGVRRAFALSLADVDRLSRNGNFSNHADRIAARGGWWWLRTPSLGNRAWEIIGAFGWHPTIGYLDGILLTAPSDASVHGTYEGIVAPRGVRPALIINQAN